MTGRENKRKLNKDVNNLGNSEKINIKIKDSIISHKIINIDNFKRNWKYKRFSSRKFSWNSRETKWSVVMACKIRASIINVFKNATKERKAIRAY